MTHARHALDLVVIGVVLISALLAMVRGFTREVLAIASWAAAAAAALLPASRRCCPSSSPTSSNRTRRPGRRPAAVVFLVTLIVVSLSSRSGSRTSILDSRIGALDRTLGFVFGAARGLLLAVVAFLFFDWLVPDRRQPEWVQTRQVAADAAQPAAIAR